MTKQNSRAKVKLDPVRVQRLRNDAKRPMAKNLTEGIALSHALLQFARAARKR